MIERMRQIDVLTGKSTIDWGALQRFKRTFTDPMPEASPASFRTKVSETCHGEACFAGARQVRVGSQTLHAHHIVIATGAEPTPLLMDSTDFLALASLPRHILFVGGGFIGFEFAPAAARTGAAVTIHTRGPRPPGEVRPRLGGSADGTHPEPGH